MKSDKKDTKKSKKSSKKTSLSTQYLSPILDSLPDATMVIDSEGKVLVWNKAMENLTGIKAKDMLGKGNYEYALPFYGKRRPVLIDLVLVWDEAYEREYISIQRHGKVLVAESYHPMLGEKGKYLSSTANRFYDASGEPLGAIESIRDITSQKELEQELLRSKEKAEETTMAKSEFLANMSHEIRTPMNAVMGLTHLALQTNMTPKQNDYLHKIQSSAGSLLGIINDILDFSKIEAGRLDIESVHFNLDSVLNNISNMMGIKAEEKGIDLIFTMDRAVPIFLIGDSLRLGQVLINLVNNAIKFTERGEVVISIDLLEDTPGMVLLQFSVRDTGIGLSETQRSQLFQPFTQADHSMTRPYEGTGLGLTISKRLVELMGGEIGIESVPGEGSTFFFCLWFSRQSKDRRKYRLPNPELKGIRVLLIDAGETSRNAITNFLEAFSFEVTPTNSVDEAMRGTAPYKLIIMQWDVSGIDGILAAKRLKEKNGTEHIPIIILAPCGRMDIKRKVTEAGLDGVLFKPIVSSSLFEVIMEVFSELPKQSFRAQKTDLEKVALKKIQGAHILLAEDNEINQMVVMEILQSAGFRVTIANDGREALDRIKTTKFDAVLMDIQMPLMDGYAATRKIRKIFGGKPSFKGTKRGEKGGQNIPIIAMTAHAMVGDRVKGLDAGMNDYITKPIYPDELISTLVKWIEPKERVTDPHEPKPISYGKDDLSIDQAISFKDILPGITVKDGLKRVGGNRWLYQKLLTMFLMNHRNTVQDIESALNSGDRDQAILLSHTLKGLAGTICAHDLQKAAADLEAALKLETEQWRDLLDHVSHLLTQVLSGITSLEKGDHYNE